ncbi:23S rRNA (guanosine(2251)-2'-O)-methyltransferase RlmB [Spirobacillus cienkowskii]|uniref:23S rRNA (guanosine(2251)-2'-O)-methyltransferase RlmB n=1 Tax=Spirobacillus cienkowskii TaxID=495820 RepID=UPI0030D18E64
MIDKKKRSFAKPGKTTPKTEKKYFKQQEPSKKFDNSSKSEKKNQGQAIKLKKNQPRELFVWGRRTVEAYLSNLHQLKSIESAKYGLHIIVDKSNKAPAQLKPAVESAQLLGIKVVPHKDAEETWPLADTSEVLNHQRICLKIPEYPVQNMTDALEAVKAANQNSVHGCVGIVLDQVQDPRNFGAIIRSAAFFGIKFVIYGTDRQADITSLVLKTSAGGAFSLSLIPTVNINRALQQLKDAGGWIVGTALSEGTVSLSELPKDRAWVAVLGNEGKGLRHEITKGCDYIVKIPGGQGTVDSLNVSVAAGILFHSLTP